MIATSFRSLLDKAFWARSFGGRFRWRGTTACAWDRASTRSIRDSSAGLQIQVAVFCGGCDALGKAAIPFRIVVPDTRNREAAPRASARIQAIVQNVVPRAAKQKVPAHRAKRMCANAVKFSLINVTQSKF